MTKLYKAIGLMSGTSMDGIDIALIESDGKSHVKQLDFAYFEYENSFRNRLASVVANNKNFSPTFEDEFTQLSAQAIDKFMNSSSIKSDGIDLIGFHGHTIFHAPEQGTTWQIGNAKMLAEISKIDVVADFRSNDVDNKGQGAPLVPIYHQCLFTKSKDPLAVINIGGVANITYLDSDNLIAFDTGPGCAIINDLMQKHYDKKFDDQGKTAKAGSVDHQVVKKLLESSYFSVPYPKSLDRNSFTLDNFSTLESTNSLATANYFSASCIAKALELLPQKPSAIILCGGGRKNLTLVDNIADLTGCKITDIDDYGYNGDAIEAEAFAYLAIRNRLGLPISFPDTTGVTAASVGGVFFPAG